MKNKSYKMIVELVKYLTEEMRQASEVLDRIQSIEHLFSKVRFEELTTVFRVTWNVLNDVRNKIWRIYAEVENEEVENEENTNRIEH